jgi:hypothetical protein
VFKELVNGVFFLHAKTKGLDKRKDKEYEL